MPDYEQQLKELRADYLRRWEQALADKEHAEAALKECRKRRVEIGVELQQARDEVAALREQLAMAERQIQTGVEHVAKSDALCRKTFWERDEARQVARSLLQSAPYLMTQQLAQKCPWLLENVDSAPSL